MQPHPTLEIMAKFNALAAHEAGARLTPFSFDPGPLQDEQVEINVQYCGICHPDLSMRDNEWHATTTRLCLDMKRLALSPPSVKARKSLKRAIPSVSAGMQEAVSIARNV